MGGRDRRVKGSRLEMDSNLGQTTWFPTAIKNIPIGYATCPLISMRWKYNSPPEQILY